MQRVKCLVGVLLAALLLTECVTNRIHVPFAPAKPMSTVDHPTEFYPLFEYIRQPLQLSSQVVGDRTLTHYQVVDLGFPSAGENGQNGNIVSARYFESKLPGRKKLVIVLPIWGSHTYPSEKITEGILDHTEGQTNVLLIKGEKDLVDWRALREASNEETFKNLVKTRMADRIKTMIIDTKRLLDWAETRPEIDATRVGLIGFSIGAMIGGATLSIEPRISAGVLVMGGANPDEIVAACPGDPESVREAVIRRFGWTADRYRALLKDLLAPFNPAHYRGAVDPHRVIIIDAYFDECVPKSSREALWQAMGQPERFSFMYSHKMAFMAMTPLGFNYMRTKIYEFLDQRL